MKKLWLAAIGVAGMSAVAVAQPWGSSPGDGSGGYGRGWGGGFMGGMMGNGMMGAGMENRPVTSNWGGPVLDYAHAQAFIQYGNEHGVADAKANTVTFSGAQIVINLVAVEPGFSDQTFELHGLVNPTVIVPRGASVQINLLNMDYGNNMEHAVEIATAPPPYPYMTMMYVGPPVAPPVSEVPWRSGDDVKQAEYAILGASFTASEPGTYWYLCPTPEHAMKGMYGKFIVQ